MERPGENHDVTMTSHLWSFHQGKNGEFFPQFRRTQGSPGTKNWSVIQNVQVDGNFYWTTLQSLQLHPTLLLLAPCPRAGEVNQPFTQRMKHTFNLETTSINFLHLEYNTPMQILVHPGNILSFGSLDKAPQSSMTLNFVFLVEQDLTSRQILTEYIAKRIK